jgi:hypothetical protein
LQHHQMATFPLVATPQANSHRPRRCDKKLSTWKSNRAAHFHHIFQQHVTGSIRELRTAHARAGGSRAQNGLLKTVDHAACSRPHLYAPWCAVGRRRLRDHEPVASCQHVHEPFKVSSIRQQTFRSIIKTTSDHSSAVGIDLRPARIDPVALLLRDLSVLRRSVQPLCAQAHVHVVFECRAHADGLPHETLGLAFVEGGHDFFAA